METANLLKQQQIFDAKVAGSFGHIPSDNRHYAESRA
jgi:hypothetical protein